MAEVENNGFARVRAWLEILSFAAVVTGIIIGFADHFANRAEERRDVIESVYTALDGEYRDYLALLLQYPMVSSRHRPDDAPPPALSADDRTRVRVLHELVIDLFERAYLEYNDPAKIALMRDTRRDQWAGWEQDIDASLRESEFRAVWNDVGASFDSRFQKYMQARIAALRSP
jgi:hypothetical protein